MTGFLRAYNDRPQAGDDSVQMVGTAGPGGELYSYHREMHYPQLSQTGVLLDRSLAREDIRDREEKTKKELDVERQQGFIQGMVAVEN